MTADGRARVDGEEAPRPASPDGSAVDGFRVLVVDRRLQDDGAARVLVRMVARWQAAGTRVVLYLLQRPARGTRGVPLPVGVHALYPAVRELRLRWALVWGFVRMLPLARRADVVLAGKELGFGIVLARSAARIVRRPFAVMVQSDPTAAMAHYESLRMQPVVRWALSTADRLVCVSPGLVPAVEALGVEPERISVVPNGLDLEAVRTAADAPTPPLPSGEGPLVVGLGRLAYQKGFDLLLRAHAQVLAAGVPHRLLVLGEGPERDALETLVDELGVAATVHMPGFAENPLPTLAAADLYCMPSRWEGFGLTLGEALIAGTPVVAADCVSGPRYVLRDGTFGDIVPVDDVEALAAAIERHLRAPERLRAAARTGREWVLANLDQGRAADDVLSILREVAGARRSGRR